MITQEKENMYLKTQMKKIWREMKKKSLPLQHSETTKPAINCLTRPISSYYTSPSSFTASVTSKVRNNDTTALLLIYTN